MDLTKVSSSAALTPIKSDDNEYRVCVYGRADVDALEKEEISSPSLEIKGVLGHSSLRINPISDNLFNLPFKFKISFIYRITLPLTKLFEAYVWLNVAMA